MKQLRNGRIRMVPFHEDPMEVLDNLVERFPEGIVESHPVWGKGLLSLYCLKERKLIEITGSLGQFLVYGPTEKGIELAFNRRTLKDN